MKLTVLGNNGPYPEQNGACSSYLLESDSGNTRILIDCGTGSLANLRGICTPDKLDAVILSHLHYDHMSDILPMQYALQFAPQREPLPVYAPKTPVQVRALLDAPCYAVKDIEDMTIGEIRITFFAARHPVETFAVRAEGDGSVFVFTGDTNETAGLADFCGNADLLLADAGLSEENWHDKAPHLSAARCGKLASEAGARRLLLTHFNPKYTIPSLVSEASAYFRDTCAAEIGKEYTI